MNILAKEKTNISVDTLEKISNTDLADLCYNAEQAIKAGGGFGWITVPPRDVLKRYWNSILLVNTNTLIVGRLNGDIAGSMQLSFYPPNNEAQKTIARIKSHFVAPWARGYGLAKAMIDYAIVKSKENNKINLNEFKENIYSQSGEDGIIKKILENLSIEKSNEFVEFGAHDGKTNSNCFNLLKNNGYQGIFIEPDKKRFQKLELNTKNYKSKNINSYVFEKGNLMLDRILSKEKISQNFDILSIDIDGHDYQIFRSISLYSPKIVIIEYNPTIPNDIEYIQPDNIKVRHGSSAKSIINLAYLDRHLL